MYPGIPNLFDLGDVDSDGDYIVQWNATLRSIGYVLQEDETEAFDSPTELYDGTSTSFDIFDKNEGIYYYRAMAYNARYGSEWSSPVHIIVDYLPDVPQNLLVSDYPEGNALNISWNINFVDTKEYILYYKTTGDWLLIENISHPCRTYNHTDLVVQE